MCTQHSLAIAEGKHSAAWQPPEGVRCAARRAGVSPAKRSASVTIATHLAMKNTDACTTDAGETPAFLASAAGATAGEVRSDYTIIAGETPAFLASAMGATGSDVTSAYTTIAGETPALQASAAGATGETISGGGCSRAARLFSSAVAVGYNESAPGTRGVSGARIGGGSLLSHFRSTIGVVRFNFSVRNGKRWSPHAIATLVSFVLSSDKRIR